MVTFITINKTVMVDVTGNEVEYIKPNPLQLESPSTITVKQQEEGSEHLCIHLVDCSETKISGDELDDVEDETMAAEDGMERKEELQGMWNDGYEPGIVLITINTPRRKYPTCTVDWEDHDCDIQITEELDQIATGLNNIALTTPVGCDYPDGQEQKENQADNVDMDW